MGSFCGREGRVISWGWARGSALLREPATYSKMDLRISMDPWLLYAFGLYPCPLLEKGVIFWLSTIVLQFQHCMLLCRGRHIFDSHLHSNTNHIQKGSSGLDLDNEILDSMRWNLWQEWVYFVHEKNKEDNLWPVCGLW